MPRVDTAPAFNTAPAFTTAPAFDTAPAFNTAPASPDGCVSASDLVSGVALDHMLAAAGLRWAAGPAAAAALAWKTYTYQVAMPAVIGFGVARRVPLPRPEDLLVLYGARRPFLTVLARRQAVAVLPDDPIAGVPGTLVLPDEATMLAMVRETLVDGHLAPVLDQLRQRVRLGARTLWGSLASGVATGVSRAAADLRTPALPTATALLAALGVDDLVALTALPDGGLRVRRNTCCLAFTLPGQPICSGCCIRPES